MKTLVDSGRYNSAGDVLREALLRLEDREKLREIRIAELRRSVEEGRLSGLADEDGEAILDRLEAKYRAMAAQRAAG